MRLEGERRSASGVARNVRREWLMVTMLSGFMLVNFADKVVFGLSAVPIMGEFDLTHTQFGLIGMSFFLFFSAAAIGVGFFANHASTKWVLAAMALGWSLCQLPMFFAPALLGLIANRLLLGVGEGPAYPVALHAAYKWVPDAHRPLATSVVGLGAAVGAGIAAPAVVYVIVTYSWQVAFGVLGGLGLLWTTLWAGVGREGTLVTNGDACTARHMPLRRYAHFLTCRTFFGVVLAAFAAYWLVATAVIWLPAYLQHGLGFSAREAGWIVALPALCQIIFAPGICWLSQSLKARGASSKLARGSVGALSVLVAGTLTVILPLARGAVLPILCVALAFSIATPIFSLGPVIIAELVPDTERGAMLGMLNAVFTLAGPLAPVLMGMIIDAGSNEVAGFRLAVMTMGGCVVAAALAGLLLINPEAELSRCSQTT